jgi:hypothetical protein
LPSIFDGTHDLPTTLPPPPQAWRLPYRRMAASLTIPTDLDEGYRLAASFLTPILNGTINGAWGWAPGSGVWAERS